MRHTVVRWTVGLVVLGLLSGCGRAEQQRKHDLQMLEITKNDCPTYFPKDRIEQANCINRAEDRYLRPHITYGDLLTVVQTQRHLLATQVARGALSPDAAAVKLAQVVADMHDRARQRENMAMAAQAQQSQATAQGLALAARLLNPPRPPAPSFPVNTSCVRMGVFVNCHSY
jgi:hypothetical protein